MLFSVIVPVYKCEKYIHQCVDSILKQTFTDFEIVLVDDGSPDRCGEICDEYSKVDLRVKVIHKPNGGVVSARKAGANAASGEYCVTVDSDDYIAADHLEELSRIIHDHSPDMISFSAIRVNKNGEFGSILNHISAGLYTGQEIEKITDSLIYDKCRNSLNIGCMPFALWSKAIKTPFLKKYQNKVPDYVKMGEDLAVLAPIVCTCDSIYILDKKPYYYRDTPNSIVNSYDQNAIKRYAVLFDYLDMTLPDCLSNNISVYKLSMILDCVLAQIRLSNSYKEFKSVIKSAISKDLIIQIKRAKVYKPSFADKIRIFLLKNRLFYILWLKYKKR